MQINKDKKQKKMEMRKENNEVRLFNEEIKSKKKGFQPRTTLCKKIIVR